MNKLEPGQIVKMQVAGEHQMGLWLEDEDGNRVLLPLKNIKGRLKKYEEVLVGFYLDKKGRLTATMKLENVFLPDSKPAEDLKRGDTVTGMVYNLTPFGAFVVTPEKYIGHIPKVDMIGEPQPGQRVSGRVTFVRDDGRFNMSMRPLKEVGRITDAERILEFLRQRDGVMPYSDETAPEVILDKFGLSKSAFKRALGKLLKEGQVEQDKGWTYLKGRPQKGE
ncbi:MAG: S1-like domain-containing RNA-binding protein [Clostridia bacterium]|nr:S1-like domain-containing RNA-binding protein [Clostridia bacterium]